MSEATPDVTIIVPAKNEQATIGEVMERLFALPIAKQIIVVNDGSDDATGDILSGYADRALILANPKAGGKGAAIRQALPHATGKAVIIQDADLEYRPEEIPILVRPILDGDAGVVYGNRFANGFPKGMALPNKLVNWLLSWSVALLFGRRISDEATCYKSFRRDILERMHLTCNRFEFCPEVTAKAIRLREQIVQVPISYEPRGKAAGKKIRWTDAPEAFWTLLKHRFSRF